jgi:hypothetical protein
MAPGNATPAEDDLGTADDRVDCGTISLGALLILEGHPIEPSILLDELGHSLPDGPSMAALRKAASAGGLTLRGVILNREDRAIDRPMIVFLKRSEHGHFQVIRPVGHTGKLAQVIDANLPPFVIDKRALFESPEWTGIALIPLRGPSWPVLIAWAVAGVYASALFGWIAPQLRRRTRCQNSTRQRSGSA